MKVFLPPLPRYFIFVSSFIQFLFPPFFTPPMYTKKHRGDTTYPSFTPNSFLNIFLYYYISQMLIYILLISYRSLLPRQIFSVPATKLSYILRFFSLKCFKWNIGLTHLPPRSQTFLLLSPNADSIHWYPFQNNFISTLILIHLPPNSSFKSYISVILFFLKLCFSFTVPHFIYIYIYIYIYIKFFKLCESGGKKNIINF